MIYQLAVALAVVATTNAAIFNEDPKVQKALFENFKATHKKSYSTMEEESRRFSLFLENLKMADHRNEQEQKHGGTAKHGITHLSDLSQVEFQANYLTADASMRSANRKVDNSLGKPDALKGVVNWSGTLTTPVKDQGYCGSCWAFSATEQIESDYMRTQKNTYILSPEQITQCDQTSAGCNGGWTEHAFNYVARAGGIEQDSDYPYTSYQGVTGQCKSSASKFVVSISGYTAVGDEDAMAAYVQSTGPLSVCVDAETWNSYNGGIMSKCGQNVDHCVQAVGVDASNGGYWIVRNSWGTSWGESGYIRLAYGANTCNIASDPTYVNF